MSLDELRALLSDDLKTAMKAGCGREVSALRAFMTALDNSTAQSQATVPRGATEAPRREPSQAEMAAVLTRQIEERAAAIETYSRLRMVDEIEGINSEIAALERYRERLR
jgi:uncharacterized protein YqeY